jgi:transcriptional regulator with XRE-family HTH domain
MSEFARENLLRLMASSGLAIQDVSEQTGLDERTIRGVLRGSNKPHPRTLHRLASGLGVSVDEFFLDPSHLLYRRFDRWTNPAVEEAIETHSERFEGWTEFDFDELHSRVGTGGAMTDAGVLQAVDQMNRKRRLREKLDVLLESSQAEVVAEIIDVLYKKIALTDPDSIRSADTTL